MNVSLAEFINSGNPADVAGQVASMLDFLAEALSAVASGPTPLSTQGVDGLATTCMYLGLICHEAAN